jgi:signal transduction histidine kinase
MKVSRKGMRLGLICLSGISVVSFFFFRSSNSVRQDHQTILDRLGLLRQMDESLETEVLRVRAFLNPSYGALIKSAADLQAQCLSLVVGSSAITKRYGPNFDAALEGYCSDVNVRVAMVEEFKSTASILRTSVELLPELQVRPPQGYRTVEDRVSNDLLIATLSYASGARKENPISLAAKIGHLERIARTMRPLAPKTAILISNARLISNLIPKIDNLLAEIIENKAREGRRLGLQPAYLNAFATAEKTALFFRWCLMASFIALLSFTMLVLTKLWRSTSDLALANQTLEDKVVARTGQLKETLRILNEQQATLVQSSKMSALGEMAGGIAHEINTPLSIISLSLQNLRMLTEGSGGSSELVLDLFDNIERTTERIGKIVSGLRNFSRDGSLAEVTPVKISDIIADTCALCQERFASQGIKLTIAMPNPELTLMCRQIQISQVLLNLLNNSFDAIQALEQRWIKIEVANTADKVTIAVADSGSGIPKEIVDKIMQPFFTTKPVGKGTGLGLSISAGIMQTHGGSLVIDRSCPNTKFVIEFPAIAAKISAKTESAA